MVSRPNARASSANCATCAIELGSSVVRDLPAGGRRFLQLGEGYLGSWVHGLPVALGGEVTEQRPGRLVRMGG